MIVVTFALPDESRAFLPMLERRPAPSGGHLAPVLADCAEQPVLVIYTGVGATPACHQRLEESWKFKPRLLISSGFAGALRADMRVGDLVLGENVTDPTLANIARRILADESRLHVGQLITQTSAVETVADKTALAAQTGAIAVDMETAWIAARCAQENVPMLSLRVVSDAADQPFPVPGHILFNAARQKPRYLALPAWLLAHPTQVAPFVRFVRGLSPARTRLAEALRAVLSGLAASKAPETSSAPDACPGG